MGENFTLACPICKKELGHDHADGCAEKYKSTNGVINMIPDKLFSTAHQIEAIRYDKIADSAEKYDGLAETFPRRRASYILGILKSHGSSGFVNIGPGFGHLERATTGFERCAVDLCYWFLTDIKSDDPSVMCVRGLAEYLPFVSGSVSCLVADSTFQSVVNREMFLYEIARVTDIGSLLILSIAYTWNYPRRPQNGFNVNCVDGLSMLKKFIQELGFDVSYKYIDMATSLEVRDRFKGDYLWIVGQKTR
jgi:hypothetical protein